MSWLGDEVTWSVHGGQTAGCCSGQQLLGLPKLPSMLGAVQEFFREGKIVSGGKHFN